MRSLWSQRNITLGRKKYLHINTTVDGTLQSLPHPMSGHKIRIDEEHFMLCRVEHLGKEVADGIGTTQWVAVNDGNALVVVAVNLCREILGACYVLFRRLVPHATENLMQFVHDRPFDVHVHVVPIANLWDALNVIVSHVHTTGISNLAVDNHNLAVITWDDVIDPRETDGIELHQLDAQGIDGVMHLTLDGLIVGGIAKGIVERTHLHPFGSLLCQEMEEESSDGVVAEIEILEMDERLGIAYRLKHVLKLIVSRLQETHGIAVVELHTLRPQMSRHQRISSLSIHHRHQRDAEYQY